MTNQKPDFRLLSMADLSRVARNEGEDITIRRCALEHLNKRERRYCKYPLVQPITNYVPDL